MRMRSDDGVELKILRVRMDLSQTEFADKFHLSVRSLQAWEQGRSQPPECVLYLIRRVVELEAQVNQAAKPRERS